MNFLNISKWNISSCISKCKHCHWSRPKLVWTFQFHLLHSAHVKKHAWKLDSNPTNRQTKQESEKKWKNIILDGRNYKHSTVDILRPLDCDGIGK